MITPFKRNIKKSFRNAGFEVRRTRKSDGPLTPDERRQTIMEHHKISMVVDVGANVGQYGKSLRESGYRGKIISFEPLSSAFSALKRASLDDPLWEAHNFAIGERAGKCEINIAKNSMSSSLLPMLDAHVQSAPASVYVGREEVTVQTLDEALSIGSQHKVLLKIDTQGFEREVVNGAAQTLKKISLIECELSLTELYQGQALIGSMLQFLGEKGFHPINFERGFSDPKTGYALQIDGIFCLG